MGYDIKIKNLNEIREAFKLAPNVVNDELQRGVKDAGKTLLSIEKREAPVSSGNLRRNIILDYKPISAIIFPRSKYAPFVNFGTGIFGPKKQYVRPKRAKVLAFKKGGKMIYAKRTKGMRANPFVERTAKMAQGKLNKIFDDILKNISEKI